MIASWLWRKRKLEKQKWRRRESRQPEAANQDKSVLKEIDLKVLALQPD